MAKEYKVICPKCGYISNLSVSTLKKAMATTVITRQPGKKSNNLRSGFVSKSDPVNDNGTWIKIASCDNCGISFSYNYETEESKL